MTKATTPGAGATTPAPQGYPRAVGSIALTVTQHSDVYITVTGADGTDVGHVMRTDNGKTWLAGHYTHTQPLGTRYRSSGTALRDLLTFEFARWSAAIVDAVSKTLPEGGPR